MDETVYVVCRTGFGNMESENAYHDPQYEGGFLDRESAREYSHQLDAELFRSGNGVATNPLHDHRLDEITSLPDSALRDRLRETGIPLPAPSVRPTTKDLSGLSLDLKEEAIESAIRHVWVEWWDKVLLGGKLSDEQRMHVWEAFDLYTFHTVREVAAPGTQRNEPRAWKAFAVVQTHWEYNDSFYDESESMLRVYRSYEEAVAECQRLNVDTEPDANTDESFSFNVVTLILNPGEG